MCYKCVHTVVITTRHNTHLHGSKILPPIPHEIKKLPDPDLNPAADEPADHLPAPPVDRVFRDLDDVEGDGEGDPDQVLVAGVLEHFLGEAEQVRVGLDDADQGLADLFEAGWVVFCGCQQVGCELEMEKWDSVS